MANIVFILGAGASAEGGCPVMANFFEQARILAHDSANTEIARDYELVDRARRTIQMGAAKTKVDVNNLESVLSSLEMAKVVGRLGSLSTTNIEEIMAALLRLIAATLDHSQSYRLNWATNGRPSGMCGPKGYDQFASLVSRLRSESPSHDVCAITFNYDNGLEFSLQTCGYDIDYGLPSGGPNRSTTAMASIPVFKMHGSLNWIRDPSVETGPTAPLVAFMPLEEICTSCGTSRPDHCFLNTRAALNRHRNNLDTSPNLPYIVPPAESKSELRRAMAPIWKKASDAIAKADWIIVCGYSMPTSDAFFRHFLTVSLLSDKLVRRFAVVDRSPEPCERFASMLGPAISETNSFFQMHGTFTDCITYIGNEYSRMKGIL